LYLFLVLFATPKGPNWLGLAPPDTAEYSRVPFKLFDAVIVIGEDDTLHAQVLREARKQEHSKRLFVTASLPRCVFKEGGTIFADDQQRMYERKDQHHRYERITDTHVSLVLLPLQLDRLSLKPRALRVQAAPARVLHSKTYSARGFHILPHTRSPSVLNSRLNAAAISKRAVVPSSLRFSLIS